MGIGLINLFLGVRTLAVLFFLSLLRPLLRQEPPPLVPIPVSFKYIKKMMNQKKRDQVYLNVIGKVTTGIEVFGFCVYMDHVLRLKLKRPAQ